MYRISDFFKEKNYKIIILLIVLLGLILRVLLIMNINYMNTDSIGYIMMADYLYKGQISDAVAIRPIYPMLYPLMLSSAKLLGLNVEKFGILLGIITGTAAIYLSWLISLKITKNIALSLITASFVAVHPQLISSSVEVLRDTPGLFFGLLTIYLILTAIEKPSSWCWVFAGFMLAVASLLRLEYLAVLVLVPCWLFFSFIFCKQERRNIISRYAPGFLLLLFVFFMVFIPFQNFFIEYGPSLYLFDTSKILYKFLGVKL